MPPFWAMSVIISGSDKINQTRIVGQHHDYGLGLPAEPLRSFPPVSERRLHNFNNFLRLCPRKAGWSSGETQDDYKSPTQSHRGWSRNIQQRIVAPYEALPVELVNFVHTALAAQLSQTEEPRVP